MLLQHTSLGKIYSFPSCERNLPRVFTRETTQTIGTQMYSRFSYDDHNFNNGHTAIKPLNFPLTQNVPGKCHWFRACGQVMSRWNTGKLRFPGDFFFWSSFWFSQDSLARLENTTTSRARCLTGLWFYRINRSLFVFIACYDCQDWQCHITIPLNNDVILRFPNHFLNGLPVHLHFHFFLLYFLCAFLFFLRSSYLCPFQCSFLLK